MSLSVVWRDVKSLTAVTYPYLIAILELYVLVADQFHDGLPS
jgi:hypothetical protein